MGDARDIGTSHLVFLTREKLNSLCARCQSLRSIRRLVRCLLRRFVYDAAFHYERDLPDCFDVLQGIASDRDEIGQRVLAYYAQLIFPAQDFCANRCRRL